MKVFLIHLSGNGRDESFLVDQETWDFVRMGTIIPEAQVEKIVEAESASDPNYQREYVYDDYVKGSSVEDRANIVFPSEFNEETFELSRPTREQIEAFVKRHGLELVATYEGRLI